MCFILKSDTLFSIIFFSFISSDNLLNGIDGINIYLVRIISFIVEVPLYGAVAFYYITNVLAYVAVIIAFVWFHNIVFNR